MVDRLLGEPSVRGPGNRLMQHYRSIPPDRVQFELIYVAVVASGSRTKTHRLWNRLPATSIGSANEILGHFRLAIP